MYALPGLGKSGTSPQREPESMGRPACGSTFRHPAPPECGLASEPWTTSGRRTPSAPGIGKQPRNSRGREPGSRPVPPAHECGRQHRTSRSRRRRTPAPPLQRGLQSFGRTTLAHGGHPAAGRAAAAPLPSRAAHPRAGRLAAHRFPGSGYGRPEG